MKFMVITRYQNAKSEQKSEETYFFWPVILFESLPANQLLKIQSSGNFEAGKVNLEDKDKTRRLLGSWFKKASN